MHRAAKAAGDQVREEDGEGAEQGEDEAGGAFVDAAGHLVDAGDEERQAGGVVARGLGGAGADGEAVALRRGWRRSPRRRWRRRPAPGRPRPPATRRPTPSSRIATSAARPARPPLRAARPFAIGRCYAQTPRSSSAPPPPSATLPRLCEFSYSAATATSAGRPRSVSRLAATRSTVVDNFSRRRWVERPGTDSLTPIADLDARIAAWSEISGKEIRSHVGADRGRRLPRRGRRRDPPRGGRPLRPAGLGALLDGLAPEGGRDPVRQRDRQPQPALRDPRPRPRVPPGQARDDGRVRPARHRHRGGLHRDRAQGPQRHAALPEAAGLALPLLEGPRLDQHPLRLPHLGPARHRPQPGGRLRDRDRGDAPATSA